VGAPRGPGAAWAAPRLRRGGAPQRRLAQPPQGLRRRHADVALLVPGRLDEAGEDLLADGPADLAQRHGRSAADVELGVVEGGDQGAGRRPLLAAELAEGVGGVNASPTG